MDYASLGWWGIFHADDSELEAAQEDMWYESDLKGSEGDAEPPKGGRTRLLMSKVYARRHTLEPSTFVCRGLEWL